jgi:hypothetical protein
MSRNGTLFWSGIFPQPQILERDFSAAANPGAGFFRSRKSWSGIFPPTAFSGEKIFQKYV